MLVTVSIAKMSFTIYIVEKVDRIQRMFVKFWTVKTLSVMLASLFLKTIFFTLLYRISFTLHIALVDFENFLTMKKSLQKVMCYG